MALRMRWPVGAGLLLLTLGCMSGRDAVDIADDDDGDELYLLACDISCDNEGLDLEIEAHGAVAAQVEFFVRGTLAATFELSALDDRTWVAYPYYPSGYSFADCGGEADFVCVVVDADGEVIREAQ